MVVLIIFYFHPYLGKMSNLPKHMFQMGWFNHQLDSSLHLFKDETGEGKNTIQLLGVSIHTSMAVLEQIHQASFTMSRNCAY